MSLKSSSPYAYQRKSSGKSSQNKLEYIPPFPYPDHVAKYLQDGVFPNIPGGSNIAPAGPLINAKYGKLTFTAWIWFTVGRLLCAQPSSTGESEDPSSISTPDLVLDNFDPFLIRYAGTKEEWYIQFTLATLNNLWCDAEWNYSIDIRTESSNKPQPLPKDPGTSVTRIDILTDYKINVDIPDFWGYVRFKILDRAQNSHEQTSGCLRYRFKHLKLTATVTTKLIDKRFKSPKYKFRAPDIDIQYTFQDAKYDILWYPFVGDELPEEEELNIPNLSADKIKDIIADVFNEKIMQNRDEFLQRYMRSVLTKVIPHVVEECRSKVDLVLTFATVLANGTDDDLYFLPPAASRLIKLGVYSVTQKHLREKILQKLAPTVKLTGDVQTKMEKLEADYKKGLALLP